MNRALRIPIEIKLNHYPAQLVLDVFVHEEALQELCLGLCLLSENLIESLVVSDERGEKVIKLRVGPKRENDPRARVSFKSNINLIELTRVSLGYMQHYFLRYYRDGVADVDSIDIQATDTDSERDDIYVTMRVANSRPSVSPEDAEKRLGGSPMTEKGGSVPT
jgi:hypothetical protein